jgi:murein DD-endopeptidase MepM/ murein hydrolase activator NlpD
MVAIRVVMAVGGLLAAAVSPAAASNGEVEVPSLKGIHVVIHEVREGEKLAALLAAYKTSRGTLESLNFRIDLDHLKPGDRVRILSRPGVFHRLQPGLTLSDIAMAYDVSQAELMRANELVKASHVKAGDDLFIPDAGPISASRRKRMSRRAVARVKASSIPRTGFGSPILKRGRIVISDRFGYRYHPITRKRQRHSGIDIIAPWGTPIIAARAGTVAFAGWKGGYGKLVIVKHVKGYSTYYAHATEILVAKGVTVQEGQVIGKVGATGDVTAPHLHFEVRKWGRPVNPVKYLRPRR